MRAGNVFVMKFMQVVFISKGVSISNHYFQPSKYGVFLQFPVIPSQYQMKAKSGMHIANKLGDKKKISPLKFPMPKLLQNHCSISLYESWKCICYDSPQMLAINAKIVSSNGQQQQVSKMVSKHKLINYINESSRLKKVILSRHKVFNKCKGSSCRCQKVQSIGQKGKG